MPVSVYTPSPESVQRAITGYGLSPAVADRLIALGPEACAFFERAVASVVPLFKEESS